jgi:acetylornithine deacetylase/succinyl-diaminopimelate desuccinylase-like protein
VGCRARRKVRPLHPGEPSNQDELGDTIKIGRRGSLNGHLIVSGTQGHVAYPQRANNPIRGLVTLVSALQAEPLDQGSAQFAPSHLEFTSVDVGNKTVNLIPGEARARFNIRFNDNHTLDSLKKLIEQRAAKAAGRKNQIHVPMGAVERRRVRDQAGAVHRPGRGRRLRNHRPEASAVDDGRHIGRAIHHAPLSRGRVRPGRPDDASDQ